MTSFDDQALNNFLEYLRIPSVHPDVNYDQCVKFLKKQASDLNLPIEIYSVVTGKPIVVITWVGQEPSLPAIMLNSHMDVVPVFPESWTYPPFDAHMDKNGDIFARGSQDMKSVGIQFIEAIRRLKLNDIKLKRTIHLSFVPDEETGGKDGMAKFVKTKDFRNLNVGFSLDEGMASPVEEFPIYNGERSIWHMHIHCPGQTGHGSLLHENTAGEKVRYIIDKFMDLRAQEKQKLKENSNFTIGDVTTINLTQLKGGVQSNVVPEELIVVFDVRIAVTVDMPKFEAMVNQWCKEAGSGIFIEYEQKEPQIACTKLDSSNPFWLAFKESTDKMKLKLKPQIFPGGTDSRYVRELGIPAIGFSPMNNTPVLLHDHNEFLNKDIFFRGIEIYKDIIVSVANVAGKK